jgi:hypothetical protein
LIPRRSGVSRGRNGSASTPNECERRSSAGWPDQGIVQRPPTTANLSRGSPWGHFGCVPTRKILNSYGYTQSPGGTRPAIQGRSGIPKNVHSGRKIARNREKYRPKISLPRPSKSIS